MQRIRPYGVVYNQGLKLKLKIWNFNAKLNKKKKKRELNKCRIHNANMFALSGLLALLVNNTNYKEKGKRLRTKIACK